MFVLVAAALLLWGFRLKGERQIFSFGWHWISLSVAIVGVVSLYRHDMYALYLPPIIYNSIFAAIFGLTLTSNSSPLIERMMQRQHEDISIELKRYAVRLTWIWFLFFVAMSITAILLAIFASPKVWSLFANILNYLLVIVLFLGQFIYAYFRYSRQLPCQPWKMFINSTDPFSPKEKSFRGGREY